MQRPPAHMIGIVIAVVAGAAGLVTLSIRSIQSDVDVTVAQVIEEHRCPHCGHVFPLSIADATAMRRQHGDIVCPACGRVGAARLHVEATGLVNNMAPSADEASEQDEVQDADTPRPATRDTTAAPGLTRRPPEGE